MNTDITDAKASALEHCGPVDDDPFHDVLSGRNPMSCANTGLVLLVAAAFGLLFNPAALLIWISSFPVHPLVESAITVADQWLLWCEQIGLTQLFAQVRELLQLMKEIGR